MASEVQKRTVVTDAPINLTSTASKPYRGSGRSRILSYAIEGLMIPVIHRRKKRMENPFFLRTLCLQLMRYADRLSCRAAAGAVSAGVS